MKERPEGVPAEAVWVESDSEWELGPVDAEGRKHGAYRYWRVDGTLCNECRYVAGKPHGPMAALVREYTATEPLCALSRMVRLT